MNKTTLIETFLEPFFKHFERWAHPSAKKLVSRSIIDEVLKVGMDCTPELLCIISRRTGVELSTVEEQADRVVQQLKYSGELHGQTRTKKWGEVFFFESGKTEHEHILPTK
jgi:hypothetical protein